MPPPSFREALLAEMSNLRAFAISLSGSVSMADDLVQETLESVEQIGQVPAGDEHSRLDVHHSAQHLLFELPQARP